MLSMSAVRPSRRLRLPAIAPARPEADDAVGREEDNGQESQSDQQPEPIAVEPDADQDVESERLENGIDERANERAKRIADPADDGDDEDVDRRRHADGVRRDLAI